MSVSFGAKLTQRQKQSLLSTKMKEDYGVHRSSASGSKKLTPIVESDNDEILQRRVFSGSAKTIPSKIADPLSSTAKLINTLEGKQNLLQEDKENASPRLRRDMPGKEITTRRSNTSRRVSFTQYHGEIHYSEREGSIEVLQQNPKDEEDIDMGENIGKQPRMIDPDSSKGRKIGGEKRLNDSSEKEVIFAAQSLPFQSPDRPVISRANAESQLITSEKIYEAPTNLHSVCYSAKEPDNLTSFLRGTSDNIEFAYYVCRLLSYF